MSDFVTRAQAKDNQHHLANYLDRESNHTLSSALGKRSTATNIIRSALKIYGIVIPAHFFPNELRKEDTTLHDLQMLVPTKYYSKPIYTYIVEAMGRYKRGMASDLSLLDGRDPKTISVWVPPTPETSDIFNKPSGESALAGTW